MDNKWRKSGRFSFRGNRIIGREEDITAERRIDHTLIGVDQRQEQRAKAGLMNISKMAACEVFLQWNVQGISTSREGMSTSTPY